MYLIFLAHWIGDFLFQNNWIARNKSVNTYVLTLHVGIYGLTLLSCLFFVYSGSNFYWFIVTNTVLHWITDFFTSKVNSYFKSKENNYTFFVFIGFDQLIHQLTLLYTFGYFIK